jgi:phytoene desaturase
MTNSPVSKILTDGTGKDKKVTGVMIENGEVVPADIVVSGADITHTHQDLLGKKEGDFSASYWNKRTLAPSAFILYLGIDKPIENFSHHNLFFSEGWDDNFKQIFKDPMWPTDPSFYICAPSKTDTTVAPAGKENLFVLVPIASGLEYTEEQLEQYGDKVIEMIETQMRVPNFKNRIEYKKVYSVKDFIKDYNAFKGTALGLAHTLGQTAIFRPNNISKKIKNLYFAGAGTNPGIGMPICIISGELVYKRIQGIKTVEPLENL